MEDRNLFNVPKNVKKDNEKFIISVEEVIPQGESLKNKIVKNNVDPFVLSNNQKYAKKSDIEYGKKSHLEYLKIMNTNKDPINVAAKGGLRPITIEEVEKHNTKGSLWTVLHGKVYDLTMYLDYHPGGEKKLMMGAGTDCTFLFNKYHSWVNYNMLVGKLQIGYLVKSPAKEKNYEEYQSEDEDF